MGLDHETRTPARRTPAGPTTSNHRRHDVGGLGHAAGVSIALLGTIRSLVPLGGQLAAFPPKLDRTAGAVLRRFRRRPPSITGKPLEPCRLPR
jgi:hypothetical protein